MKTIAEACRFITILAALVLVPFHPASLAAQQVQPKRLQPLVGVWKGSMQSGINVRQIKVWLDREGGGRFQVVGVTTDRNPVKNVRLAGDEVTFMFPSVPPMMFRGKLTGGVIRGHYEELGRKFWFQLAKERP